MKKIIAFVLCIVMILSCSLCLFSCSDSSNDGIVGTWKLNLGGYYPDLSRALVADALKKADYETRMKVEEQLSYFDVDVWVYLDFKEDGTVYVYTKKAEVEKAIQELERKGADKYYNTKGMAEEWGNISESFTYEYRDGFIAFNGKVSDEEGKFAKLDIKGDKAVISFDMEIAKKTDLQALQNQKENPDRPRSMLTLENFVTYLPKIELYRVK